MSDAFVEGVEKVHRVGYGLGEVIRELLLLFFYVRDEKGLETVVDDRVQAGVDNCLNLGSCNLFQLGWWGEVVGCIQVLRHGRGAGQSAPEMWTSFPLGWGVGMVGFVGKGLVGWSVVEGGRDLYGYGW